MFGWEKEEVIVHRIREKSGDIPRINLVLTKQGNNTHYSWVKRLTALLYDQNSLIESKHFCKRCLHGYSRRDLLERLDKGKRYAKANNLRVKGYEPAQLTNYITYMEANNLYGWAMSQPLPKKGFHWKRVMPTEEQKMKMKWNSKKGWIKEVNLEYPEELHEAHNYYPLAPEKKTIKLHQMSSEYQRRLMADLDLTMPNAEKLALTLEDKEKYVVHYKNL